MKKIVYISLLTLSFYFYATAQTIAEKKAGIVAGESDLSREAQDMLLDVNKQLEGWQEQLRELYSQVIVLYQNNAPEEDYQELLDTINAVKEKMITLESAWRTTVAGGGVEEGYSLWHQPDTTIEQLVIDYGSQNFVYLIPSDVGSIRVSINSSLPIPRASWEEMLETILIQNGVGIKQLNPFLRELYPVKQDNSGIELITNNRRDLDLFPDDARICFMLSPDASELRRIWLFLGKFINPNTTVLQMIGRDILLISQTSEVRDLIKLYDFVSANRGDRDYKVVTLSKVDAEEMAKILGAIFDQLIEQPKAVEKTEKGEKPKVEATEINDVVGLKVLTLGTVAQALFLIGTPEEIKKAEEIIKRVESQVGEARARTIFWYTARHSSPEDLAEVLLKIYNLMIQTGAGYPAPPQEGQNPANNVNVSQKVTQPAEDIILPPPTSLRLYSESFYQDGGYIVNPAPVEPGLTPPPDYNRDRENFIVDPKTNSIVMVVEADILPKLKEVIKKLDVPKKMVQIEVLLFEKRMDRSTDYGLNLLKIGDRATNTQDTGVAWNNTIISQGGRPENAGVFQFFLSRMKGESGIPAFDYFYRFLISQQDIQINSAPSVIAINQTPALIAIKDEISINTGVFEVETAKGVTLKDAFTRAQYGITIAITPTIHMHAEDDSYTDYDYVTLETDITFDTIQPRPFQPDRPDVSRRQVKNNVRVPDGQSVIIGGLRRKIKSDSREYIPFIGELPGIGKLFSITGLRDQTTEMFLIITPKIIVDPAEDYERIRQKQLCMRPGDIPAFLCQLERAQECEKTRVLENSMRILFGRPCDRCVVTEEEEFDGGYAGF